MSISTKLMYPITINNFLITILSFIAYFRMESSNPQKSTLLVLSLMSLLMTVFLGFTLEMMRRGNSGFAKMSLILSIIVMFALTFYYFRAYGKFTTGPKKTVMTCSILNLINLMSVVSVLVLVFKKNENKRSRFISSGVHPELRPPTSITLKAPYDNPMYTQQQLEELRRNPTIV